jgi:hypothetical protein
VGASSPDDKLTGDLGNVIEATQIGGRRSDFLQQENWRRAIWDFCNNIGTQRKCRGIAVMSAPEGAADVAVYVVRPSVQTDAVEGLDTRPSHLTLCYFAGMRTISLDEGVSVRGRS